MKPELRIASLYILLALTMLWGSLIYRSVSALAHSFGTHERANRDGCEYTTIENLPPRQVVIVPKWDRPTITHPGGWHWRVECPDGSTFHVRVARP